MANYADYLNDTFNCNIEVDYDTGDLTNFDPTSMYDKINLLKDEKRKSVSMEALTDPQLENDFLTQYESLQSAQKELDKLYNSYGKAGIAAYQYYKESEAAGRNTRIIFSIMRNMLNLWDCPDGAGAINSESTFMALTKLKKKLMK